jgi:hypothetical protein
MKRAVRLTDRVLQYIIENGSITSKEAFEQLGVTRLSASIFILRQEGHKILGINETTKNRYGDKVTYCRYTLGDEENVEM